ncbi:apolipoprotein N-acyltransferase [Alcanivorax sp. S6407]|uniref:apolipoprotein N-acyltransferase n=1 Tax=Alcanivorax sp. S6407 TaxID=2926424 RepID=UPI001FF6F35B|nr:apolipoprotein N-acyltransferase [Alcanivorax sp. S6407]MCK0153250.1 apolipoprotein N-acyltransferase [Alcanivorax sp. S6407]
MRDRLLALIAGLLFPLAFAPFDLWPALFASIAAGFFTLQQAGSAREALLRGWLYGMGMFGFGISWLHVSMHDYGFMPLWMAIPFTAIFAALMALFYGITFYLGWRLGRTALAFTGCWLLLDWVRGWFLTGFPWLYAGYGLIDTPLAPLAPVGGVWLLTLAAVLLASTVIQLRQPGLQRWLATGLSALVLLGSAIAHTFTFTHPSGEMQPVALVQGNIPQDLKWQISMRERTREIYHDLTATIPDGYLVIWPESALTEFYQTIDDFVEQEGEALRARDGGFITGVPWRSRENGKVTYRNSIAAIPLIAEDGHERVYHKQKLVPFGEYVPMQSLIRGLIPFFDLPMSGFTPGDPAQDNLHTLGHTIAPFICYEILYPEQVATRSHGADALITISNDAWFGTSAGPLQHFQMARMRALETGRWLLRGTNNGVTAVIDDNGKVVDALPQFQRDVLLSQYQPRQGNTPFMVTGVWPWLLLALLLMATGSRLSIRKQSHIP